MSILPRFLNQYVRANHGGFVGDHIFGLLPLMASLLNGAGGTADGIEDPRVQIEFDKSARSFHLLSLIIPYSQNAGS